MFFVWLRSNDLHKGEKRGGSKDVKAVDSQWYKAIGGTNRTKC